MSSTTPIDDRLITTFGRLVEAYSRMERWLGSAMESETGLPHVWFEVLVRLARSEDEQLAMSVLADQVALSTSGVTRLVDRMQMAGYVERRPCPTDRRISYAGLTGAGREVLERAATVHARNLSEAFDGFEEWELDTLDAVLDRVREAAAKLPRQR